MDEEILKVFTMMAANGSEKAFCVTYNRPATNSRHIREHHLTIPFEGSTYSLKRDDPCVKDKESTGIDRL